MASPRTRLIRLLDRGFYPVELPPPFKTRNFSKVSSNFVLPNSYTGSTTFFDGATFRGPLRTFGVINPINYMLLSRFIADNWSNIATVFQLSKCSGSRPKFPPVNTEGRAIETASLATKRQSQRHLASAYPVILGLDINRFYGSIYTHSIPWSALGKHDAKQRHRNKTLSGHWSDKLDKLVRDCNQQQTVGLPIGPDTSRIVSELILSRIDFELTATGSGLASPQIYHNIDDYQIGCMSISEAENAQSRFIRALSQYELRLNDFKTSIDHGISFSPSNFQRHFDVLSDQRGRNFVEHFFEILYTQIPIHPNTNVVGYALKRFARKLACNSERNLVREYLQRLIYAAPHQARWTFPLLLGICKSEEVNGEMRRLIGWGVQTCARRNDVGSLLWYLYAAIFLKVRVSAAQCGQCFGISNELVDLVLFHGRSEGLFSFNVSEIRRRYSSNNFASPAWLPIYEVGRRDWDTSPSFAKLGTVDDAERFYQRLNNGDVEFYITDQDQYEVDAFEGWRLTQRSFEIDEDVIEDDGIAYRDNNLWENYD